VTGAGKNPPLSELFGLLGSHLLNQRQRVSSLTLPELGKCQEKFGLVIFFGEEIGQWDLKRFGEGRCRVHVGTVYFLLVAVDSDATTGLVIRHEPSQRTLRQSPQGTGCLQALRKDGGDGLGQAGATVAEPWAA
jgi:hypothetical protein